MDLTGVTDRSWRWFTVRVMGLLDMAPVYDPRDNNKPHHASRLGRKLHPAD